jgi:hypothetical protein
MCGRIGTDGYVGVSLSASVGATRLLCALEPWLRLNVQISVIGVDCYEEVVQKAF